MIKRFLLLFLLFASILSQKALAISIVLDGTQILLGGHQCQTAKYRFGTQSSYQGQDIDLILEVNAEDNEYNSDKCVDIVDNVIGFRLRDKDYYDNRSYIDIKVTVVKRGTEVPLNVDTITVTNFDLDNNPTYTDTDDVYYKNPSKVYLSEFTNVTKSTGNFFSNYTTKLKGQSTGNCNDDATLLEKECRAGVSFDNTSSFYARVQNDNAYGTISSSYASYRLIQFSFELKDLTPLMSEIEVPCGTVSYSTVNNSWIEGNSHTQYTNNINISKTIKVTNSKSIKVTINGETERNFDWIYIYDENGNQVHIDSGHLNSTPFTISGSEVTIKLTTDGSVTKSGVSVEIEGIGCEEEPIVSLAKSVSITEGDIGDKELFFTINLDNPAPNGGVTVQIQPHNITANEGEDYSRVTSSIFFAQGETQKNIAYKIHGDTKVEDNETFSVELHNPQHAKLDETHKTAIGTIINDEISKPIGCLQTAWMFQNRPTDINALNLANGQMTSIKNNVSTDNINALGFNKKDGYFWGYNYSKSNGTVTRIGMKDTGDWIAEDFLVSGLNGFKSYVGDIDSNGHLYLKGSGSSKRVVVIDLDPKSSNYLKKIRDFKLNFSLGTADWGFNAKDNMLYAVNSGNSNKYLYKIDPSNGHKLSRRNTLLTGNRGFGASFFDANGFYYIYDNRSGNIYRIDVASSAKAVLFANADKVSLNDGAMCTDAEFKFDFGDLPDIYPTRLESNGARHSLPTYGEPTVYLGSGVSSENNGKPSANANLDEKDDGVKLNNNTLQNKTINAGTTITLKVTTHGVGFLSAWIDWNGDGDFNDSYEKIATNIDGSGGVITFNVTAPSSAIDLVTYARFRYSYQRDLAPTGNAIDGEVEDYKINIHGNLEPFICSDKLYLSNRTELGVGSGDSGATWLHSFYAMTPIYTPLGDGFASGDGGYNAIGYNIKDNFIYALYGNELLKIDKNAHIKNLGVISGLPNTQLYAGEFDRDGFYYVSGRGGKDNKMYKIDIAQRKVIKTITLSSSVKFWDMAIDTTNRYFYAMLVKDGGDDFINDKFVKIDKESGVITVIGNDFKDMNSYISLIFTDKNGKIITISNNKGMYEINSQTGRAYWIKETPELSYYNDGTSCPDASFILPPHIPRLSIGDVTQAEGDSGESNFNFKISIDADLPMINFGMPIMFFYKVIDGKGNSITPPHGVAMQSDHDFKGGGGIAMNMNIFSSNRTQTISVPVYGDDRVEKDEEFFVEIYFPNFFPSNFCLMGKDRGIGLILNDDMKFQVIRSSSTNIDDDLIYTQIAGRDFDYSIVSKSIIKDITLKVELINNSSGEVLYNGYKHIEEGSRIDIDADNDLDILTASKDVNFKVSFLKDDNGTIVHGNYADKDSYNSLLNRAGYSEISQEASRHFSIRPAGYKIYIKDIDESNNSITYRDSSYSGNKPLKLVSGYDYKIEAKAVSLDINRSKTKGYTTSNGDLNVTLLFKDKSSCIDKSDTTINNYIFNNGSLQNSISHNNVGKYLLRVEDSSWSSIDKDIGCIANSSTISSSGEEKSGCNISTTSIDEYNELEMKFYPYSFYVDAKVENRPNSGKNYIYMGDLNSSLDMGLDIKATITAIDKKDNKLTNFTKSCVASDVTLSLDYNITTDSIDHKNRYSEINTTKGSIVRFKKVVSYNEEAFNINSVENTHLDDNITISKNQFLNSNEGNSSINILFNLTKNFSEPINPVEIRFNSLESNGTTISKIKGKDRTANGIGTIDTIKKLYFSQIAPDMENYPDEYEGVSHTPISVLIFCNHTKVWCSNMIGDNGLNNIKTKYGWYTAILHDSNIDGGVIKFTVNNPLSAVNPKANKLPNFNENKLGKIVEVTTGYSGNKFPSKVEVDMEVSPWLKYNRDPNRDGIPFWKNTFRDRNATWSGEGKAGNQIEIKTTTRVAKKIFW